MFRILAALMALAFLSIGATASAAESYDNCTGFITSLPTVITTQGTWCLKQDLATAVTSGNAISINTNNVTIDCNNFKLGGLAAGAGTIAIGIYAQDRVNETVRHCNVRGFYAGIDLVGSGGGHVVEANRLDGNTSYGVDVDGDGSLIRNNLVFNTGGSTVSNTAYGIVSNMSVDVLDNSVFGVTATSGGGGNAVGINTGSEDGGTVAGNRIRGLVKDGAGQAYGIYNSFSGRISVRDNNVFGPGAMGIHCFDASGSMKDNQINGFTSATDNCIDSGGNAIIP